MNRPNQSTTGKRAVAHSAIYAAGNIARQLAGFIMLPVYTHHLSPNDYGVVGLLTAAMALMEVFFGARLAQAVPKFYYDQTDEISRKSIISTALFVTSSVSTATVLALIAVREPIANFLFQSIDYGLAVGLFSTLLLTQAIEYYALTYIRILERPWLFVILSLGKLVIQLSLNIWFVVYEEMGVTGVALSGAIASGIFALVLTCFTLLKTGIRFQKSSAREMIIYCWPLWLAGLAGLYMGSADRYFINIFQSTGEVGLFELATKLAAVLALLIWQPFDQFWQTERFKIQNLPNASQIYGDVFHAICIFLFLTALGISLYSKPLLQIMAAPDFFSANLAVPFLCLSMIFSCLCVYANFAFLVTNNTLWISKNSYITAAIFTALLLLLTPKLGFIGAALAGAITNIVRFLIIHFTAKKIYAMNLSLSTIIKAMCIYIVGCFLSLLIETPDIFYSLLLNTIIAIPCLAFLIKMLLKNGATVSLLSDNFPVILKALTFFSIVPNKHDE